MDRGHKTKKLVIPATCAVMMIGAAVAAASSCSSKTEPSCAGEGGCATNTGGHGPGGGGSGGSGGSGGTDTGSGGAIA